MLPVTRHSYASTGVTEGLSLPIIAALLGHKHSATTARYAHLAARAIRVANDSIGSRIAAAMQFRVAEPETLTEQGKTAKNSRDF